MKPHFWNPLSGFHVIFKYKNLFHQLVKRNVAGRYRGSMLGMTWSVLLPLVMLLIYTFVFAFVLKAKFPGVAGGETRGAYAVIMFCGMAVFNIFSEGLNLASTVIVCNPNFVKKVIFPLEILPITQIVSTFFFGLIWFVLVILGALGIFHTLHWTILLFPLTLIPLLVFTAGCAYFVSAVGVYLRDAQHLVAVALQILIFMTPIFYPAKMVPPRFLWVLQINPLYWFVEETRKILLYGQQPAYGVCALLWIGSLLVFHLGWIWFEKTKKGFADVL